MFLSKFSTIIFLCLVLIMPMNVNASGKLQAASKTTKTSTTFATPNVPYSTWLWNTNQITTNADQVINFLSTHKVTDLYLQVNYSISANTYKNFIKKADLYNIRVHALDGSSEWVSSNGTSLQNSFFAWLTNYQNSALPEEKFKGVHLDVEPYLNSQYSTNMNAVLQNYQACFVNSVSKCNELGLTLGVDIPFWFDGVYYTTPYGSGNLAQWVIKNVKNVTVMAYRDTALGNNGIIGLTSTEMNLGKQYGSVITIAVETQQCTEGSHLSFYEEGQKYMYSQLNTVYTNYSIYSSFGGFAIHHVASWMALKS